MLAAQNIGLFWGHYAGTLTFPFDFQKTYHAVPFFWITALGAGVFPSWIPYQGVGSPLAMNLQSGLFYPPLWFFPLTGVTYSLHAAAVLQALHVLLGGLGMSALARVRGLSWRWALLAGAAYQVSGGFFSNAEHADIVRGYAWTPWLLAALSRRDGESSLPLRALSLPVLIYLMLTGTYPGQSLAALVLSFGFLAAELVPGASGGNLRERSWRLAPRAGLLVLGVLMATVHMLPAWLQRSEVILARDTGNAAIWGLGHANAFTTFLPYDAEFLGGPYSMRSLFVTLPVLAGVFCVSRRILRAELPFVALLVAAAALIRGETVFRLAGSVLPPLGLSRFPAADYRAPILVPLVLLGVLGLRHALEERARAWVHVARALALAAFIGSGIQLWCANAALTSAQAGELTAVLAGTVLVLAAGRFHSACARFGALALLAFVVGDGYRMHLAVTERWRVKARHQDYEEMRAQLTAELQATRELRPQRREMPTFDGYLRGRFIFFDYAASDHLAGAYQLMGKGPLERFVKRASSPVLLAEGTALDTIASAIAKPDASLGTVKTEAYGPAGIRYAVAARAPAILVENELAFPGWTAVRGDDGTELEPVAAARPLRAWKLPAGEYELSLAFRMPGMSAAAGITLAATAAWLVLGVIAAKRSRNTGRGAVVAPPEAVAS